jgi:hypothetical protein
MSDNTTNTVRTIFVMVSGFINRAVFSNPLYAMLDGSFSFLEVKVCVAAMVMK